jgi:integrase
MMWEAVFKQGDLLDGQGPMAHVRRTTQISLEPRYGRWLEWLRVTEPHALDVPPPQRATLDRFKAWLTALDHTAPMTRLAFVDGVLRVLMAAHPERDWSAHRTLRARLKKQAGRGEQTRKKGRILSSSVLLDAGLNLALVAADEASSPIWRAIHVRDGAIIALLALLPIRRRALVGLRIGESIFFNDNTATLALPASLTKSGVPWEAEIPIPVIPALMRYMRDARPVLLARAQQPHDALWVDRKGGALSYDAVAPAVKNGTERMLGLRISPHLFRDAAATTLARHSSRAATLIRPVLSHSSDRTAERHYNHAKTIEAGRDYAALLATLKEGQTR